MPQISQRLLRIEIDGTWTASEFATAFRSFNDLYSIRAILEFEREALMEFEEYALGFPHMPPSARRIAWLVGRRLTGERLAFGIPPLIDVQKPRAAFDLLEPNEKLSVRRIQFKSPGFKDLAGVGEVIGHVTNFLLKLMELFVARRERQLANVRRELENEGKRIENAKSLVELARNCGYTKAEVRKLVAWVDSRQGLLVPLIEAGKITNVRLLDEDQEKSANQQK